MGQPRPKLWIVGSPGVPVDTLRSSLDANFDVSIVQPGPLADASGNAALVLSSVGDLRKLTAAPEGVSALLDAMGQGVCLVRLGGEVVWSNTKFARFDGSVQRQIALACAASLSNFRQR